VDAGSALIELAPRTAAAIHAGSRP
jgi:hypothetical protein